MERLRLVVTILLISVIAAGCGLERDPREQLAMDIFAANTNFMSPFLLGEVRVRPHDELEGQFDVTVPFPITYSQSFEEPTVEEVLLGMHNLSILMVERYREEGLEDQIHSLAFEYFHPANEEVLIEVQLSPDARTLLDFQRPEVIQTFLADFPNQVTHYESRLGEFDVQRLVHFYSQFN